MIGIVTVASLMKDYQDYLQAQNSKINPYAPNDFWEVDAGASALQMLDLYMNLQLVRNSIYPQNSAGDQVDEWIFSSGLPARGGLTYGTIQAVVLYAGDGIINDGDIFTDLASLNPPPLSYTNNQYQAFIGQNISINSIVTLYALNPGSNTIEPIGNKLSNTDGTKVIQVQLSTNGQQQESDQQAIERVLQVKRQPRAGARESDYVNYARQASDQVTDVITIPGFYVVNNVSLLGVFILVGTNITDYQLNQGLLPSTTFIQYSRQASQSLIDQVNIDIENLKLVALNISVGTVTTKIVYNSSNPLEIKVALPVGYDLNTMITVISQDQNFNPIPIKISVRDLVKREARRALCNQQGGTEIGNNLYITMDSIISALNDNLSVEEGSIAQILVNIKIDGQDIQGGTQSGNNIAYVFDISDYNAIEVTQQTGFI